MVQAEEGIRSYRVTLEDGTSYRRNRRHIRQTRESAVQIDPETPSTSAQGTQTQEPPVETPAQRPERLSEVPDNHCTGERMDQPRVSGRIRKSTQKDDYVYSATTQDEIFV